MGMRLRPRTATLGPALANALVNIERSVFHDPLSATTPLHDDQISAKVYFLTDEAFGVAVPYAIVSDDFSRVALMVASTLPRSKAN